MGGREKVDVCSYPCFVFLFFFCRDEMVYMQSMYHLSRIYNHISTYKPRIEFDDLEVRVFSRDSTKFSKILDARSIEVQYVS